MSEALCADVASAAMSAHREVDEMSGAEAQDWTSSDFRRALGHFCSGVVVVTACDKDGPVGITCQSFISLSLDPPLIAFAPAHASHTYARIRSSGRFCVNILSAGQQAMSDNFAGKHQDKFSDIKWRPARSGSPILPDVLGWIDCRLEREIEAGDHWIAIGAVQSFDNLAGEPLLFFRGGYKQLASR